MKKRLLLIFICLIVYGQLVSQNDYYYSANKKIFMTNTENKYVIGVSDSLDFKILSKVAENITPLFLQSYIVTLKDTIFAKQTLSHFDRCRIPVKTIGDVEIIFTGEVLLKPKTEYGIQPIIAFSNGTLSIKESTAYNTYVMNVSNWDSLFYLNNHLEIQANVTGLQSASSSEVRIYGVSGGIRVTAEKMTGQEVMV